jgi:precorrin-2 dehydrogenase / sirohydrochlorin ferrochelatase
MKTYPVCLVGLERRRVVVVGGGDVAERKVGGLLEAGARITVISPTLTGTLHSMAACGQIATVERPYRAGDLDGAFLAFAATGDEAVNHAVCAEAERAGCLVNSASDPVDGNVILPAVVRRGEITVAIATGGASPALAHHLRERTEAVIGPEYADLAALLAELRPILQVSLPTTEARAAAAARLIAAGLLGILQQDGIEAGRRYAMALIEQLADKSDRRES